MHPLFLLVPALIALLVAGFWVCQLLADIRNQHFRARSRETAFLVFWIIAPLASAAIALVPVYEWAAR